MIEGDARSIHDYSDTIRGVSSQDLASERQGKTIVGSGDVDLDNDFAPGGTRELVESDGAFSSEAPSGVYFDAMQRSDAIACHPKSVGLQTPE